MKNFRRYLSYVLAILLILILVILGLFNKSLFDQLVVLIKTIWPAIVVLFSFAGLAVGGVLKNQPKSLDEVFDDIYIQIAILLFFLFVLITLIVVILEENEKRVKIPIYSDPPGATIYEKGDIYEGKMTPDTLYLKKNKIYEITLEKTGYDKMELSINTGEKTFEKYKHLVLKKKFDLTFICNYDNTYLKINNEVFNDNKRTYNTSISSGPFKLVYAYENIRDSITINVISDTVIIVPDDLL